MFRIHNANFACKRPKHLEYIKSKVRFGWRKIMKNGLVQLKYVPKLLHAFWAIRDLDRRDNPKVYLVSNVIVTT